MRRAVRCARRPAVVALIVAVGVALVGASGEATAHTIGLAANPPIAGEALATPTSAASTPDDVVLDAAARALALEFSPLPPVPADPTNAVADDPAAARLGQFLFFDTRLSANGEVSCATCHDPARGWSDGRTLAKGIAHHPRHTQPLVNVGHNRWFFWDGRKDSLWSQALGPLEDPREHGQTRLGVAHLIATDADYARAYGEVFGELPELSDAARFPAAARPVPGEPGHPHARAWDAMAPADQRAIDRVFSNLGKAIAAFERRLVSDDAPFDRFVRGLRSGDAGDLAALSSSAQRGFAVFAGKGRCLTCHDGSNFTDGEFHTNRVPTGEGADPGRGLGIVRLLEDPFNGAGAFADDGGALAVTKLSFPPPAWELPGVFKTPTLRNVALSAPYMHEGQLATLQDVIAFYDTLEGAAPVGQHDERILAPLGLTGDERADLLAFLQALTDDELPPELLRAPETPWLP